jgi:hypothetical protein
MPLREFTDSRGHAWRVWETRPTTDNVRPQLAGGWLTFERESVERESVRRRVAPIPESWAEMPDDELRLLCVNARPERPRRRVAE